MSETAFALLGSVAVMFALMLGCGGMLLWFMFTEHAEHQAFLKSERAFEKRMKTRDAKDSKNGTD